MLIEKGTFTYIVIYVLITMLRDYRLSPCLHMMKCLAIVPDYLHITFRYLANFQIEMQKTNLKAIRISIKYYHYYMFM